MSSVASATKSPTKASEIPSESRLFYPTVSYVAGQVKLQEERMKAKLEEDEASITRQRRRTMSAVNPNATFLLPTASAIHSSWKNAKEAELNKPAIVKETETRKLSRATGPNVESKLTQITKAMENSKWRPPEEIEAERIAKNEEEAKKQIVIGANKKVTKVSDHILIPTKAQEYSKLQIEHSPPITPSVQKHSPTFSDLHSQSESQSLVSTDTHTRKVKKPSSRLLTPTAANEYARWQPPEDPLEPFRPPPPPKKSPTISAHLLAPTAKMHLSTYVKPVVEVDPRHLGWNDKFHLDQPQSPIPTSSPTYRSYYRTPRDFEELPPQSPTIDEERKTRSRRVVSDVSGSLLRPTLNNYYGRWNPPPDEPHLPNSKPTMAPKKKKKKKSKSKTETETAYSDDESNYATGGEESSVKSEMDEAFKELKLAIEDTSITDPDGDSDPSDTEEAKVKPPLTSEKSMKDMDVFFSKKNTPNPLSRRGSAVLEGGRSLSPTKTHPTSESAAH